MENLFAASAFLFSAFVTSAMLFGSGFLQNYFRLERITARVVSVELSNRLPVEGSAYIVKISLYVGNTEQFATCTGYSFLGRVKPNDNIRVLYNPMNPNAVFLSDIYIMSVLELIILIYSLAMIVHFVGQYMTSR